MDTNTLTMIKDIIDNKEALNRVWRTIEDEIASDNTSIEHKLSRIFHLILDDAEMAGMKLAMLDYIFIYLTGWQLSSLLEKAEVAPSNWFADNNDILDEWVLTDDDCCQYRKALSYNVFQFMQVCDLEDGSYGIARDTINLRDYSDKEIEEEIRPFGYTLNGLDLSRISDRALVAECIFEDRALQNIKDEYEDYDDAAAAVYSEAGKEYVAFENGGYKVATTPEFEGRIYNKVDRDICLRLDADVARENGIENDFVVPAGEYIDVSTFVYDGNTKRALHQGDYEVVPLDKTGYAFKIGNTVFVANPNSPYMGMVGRVTDIHILGTEEHDTENETDDIVVDFSDYADRKKLSKERVAEIEANFSDVSDVPKKLEELPLDYVIMAPEELLIC